MTERLSPERIAEIRTLLEPGGFIARAALELFEHIDVIEAELVDQCFDLYWMQRANAAEKKLSEEKRKHGYTQDLLKIEERLHDEARTEIARLMQQLASRNETSKAT
jgi:hypothetical protein